MKKPKAIFKKVNGGGSYKLEIYLTENHTEKMGEWARSHGSYVYDYQLNSVIKDLKKDGFKVVVV